MKIDSEHCEARDPVVSPLTTARVETRRWPVFPSYRRIFSAFLQLASRNFAPLSRLRERHLIVTFSLQPSLFGVI